MRGFSTWFRIAVATSIVTAVSAAGPVPAEAGPISEPDFYTNVPADLASYAPGDVIRWESEKDLGPKFVDLSAYRRDVPLRRVRGRSGRRGVHGLHPGRHAPCGRLAHRRVGTRHVGHR